MKRCSHWVTSGWRGTSHACQNRVVVERAGKPWCYKHDPEGLQHFKDQIKIMEGRLQRLNRDLDPKNLNGAHWFSAGLSVIGTEEDAFDKLSLSTIREKRRHAISRIKQLEAMRVQLLTQLQALHDQAAAIKKQT